MPTRPRVLLVQYAGDFRVADRVLQETGRETYYGHRYVLETLAQVQATLADTAVMCCRTEEEYAAPLASGVTAMGAGADPYVDPEPMLRGISGFEPTHVVLLSPIPAVLRWCKERDVRVMCVWADSFSDDLISKHVRHRRLRRLLRDPRVEWVADHGRNACRSLVRLGVDPAKVIAWDWPHVRSPRDSVSKAAPQDGTARLFFAGLVIPSKGIFDVVEALAHLAAAGIRAELRIAGAGDDSALEDAARSLGVWDRITMLGLISNDEVVAEMAAASAVVVPSRHDYAEGLPLTIYEALATRTPIVGSDHPMFEGILVHDRSALVFRAGDASGMAHQVARLLREDGLYERLSSRSLETWEKIQVEVKWGELVTRWVRDQPADTRWLADHTSTPAVG